MVGGFRALRVRGLAFSGKSQKSLTKVLARFYRGC